MVSIIIVITIVIDICDIQCIMKCWWKMIYCWKLTVTFKLGASVLWNMTLRCTKHHTRTQYFHWNTKSCKIFTDHFNVLLTEKNAFTRKDNAYTQHATERWVSLFLRISVHINPTDHFWITHRYSSMTNAKKFQLTWLCCGCVFVKHQLTSSVSTLQPIKHTLTIMIFSSMKICFQSDGTVPLIPKKIPEKIAATKCCQLITEI